MSWMEMGGRNRLDFWKKDDTFDFEVGVRGVCVGGMVCLLGVRGHEAGLKQ